jgi:hypothetical protein
MRILHLIPGLFFLALSLPAYGQIASNHELTLAKSTVSRYCDAWGTVDPAARKALVTEIWAEGAEYIDPQPVRITGRQALTAQILKFQQQFPGAVFRCTAVQAHHGFVGYTWVMVTPDGTERFKGTDFGELDAAGRLVRIVSFFGASS